ncbi:translation initiation factor-related [Holotrichia oblita]|nr:translation initiation factor-related [Holotrichia oblita]KAI4463306.1 translation initiation factor-related [Holotrichia oblita]
MEVLQDDFSPPTENQQIVKILSSKGNNLHEVQTPDNNVFLASMPSKFRKNVWVKRGDYVLVEPIKEGDKVKAEMVRIITQEHIKYFKKDGVWPSAFNSGVKDKISDDDELFVNTNHRQFNDGSNSENSNSSDTN